jgi:hypothetical protein
MCGCHMHTGPVECVALLLSSSTEATSNQQLASAWCNGYIGTGRRMQASEACCVRLFLWLCHTVRHTLAGMP